MSLASHSTTGRWTTVCLVASGGTFARGGQNETQPRRTPVDVSKAAATILVVDDDPRVRRLARRMLSDLGYRVIEAGSAAAATGQLEKEPEIDLLFTDVVMPGEIDGRELGHWVEAHCPGVRVLLTSGFRYAGRPDTGDHEDFPFLAKPYSQERLARAIRNLLTRSVS